MEENAYLNKIASTEGKESMAEFEESFWQYIPETLISNTEIDANRDWSDMIVQEAWRMYIYSNVDRAFIFKLMENMIYAFKRYHPNFE